MTLTKLREIAMAATPGPWDHVHVFEGEEAICHGGNSSALAVAGIRRDAEHIAAFSPDRVLKLLDCAEALEGAENPEGFITLLCGYMDAALWALKEGETKEAEGYLSEGVAAISKLGPK